MKTRELNYLSIIVIVTLFISANYCHAKKTQSYPEEMLGEEHYSKQMIENKIKEIKTIVTIGYGGDKNRPVYCGHLRRFSETFGFYENFSKIEAITGISRKWFGKVKKVLAAMYPVKNKMDTALKNQKLELHKKLKKQYAILLKQFVELIKKPERADPKSVKAEQKANKRFLDKLDKKLSPEGQIQQVNSALKSIRKLIEKEKSSKKPLSSFRIKGFMRVLDFLISNKETEKTTGNQIEWYISLKSAINKMYENRVVMEKAERIDDKSTLAAGKAQYDISIKKVLHIMDHPIKVNPEKKKKTTRHRR